MLQFAANLSLLFAEYPLIERFAHARAAGFEAVEIQFPYELPINAIQAELEQHNLKLVLINIPAGDLMQGGDGLAGIPGRQNEFRFAALEALRYIEALGVPCVNVLAGCQPIDSDLLPCLQTLADNLRYATTLFASTGTTVTLEAINGIDIPRFLIQTPEQAMEMLEVVERPYLKIQFDAYHVAMMGDPILLSLAQYLPHVGHIQFADCPNRHEPGTGTLNFAKWFEFIRQSDYAGYVAAEYRPSRLTRETLDWFDRYR